MSTQLKWWEVPLEGRREAFDEQKEDLPLYRLRTEQPEVYVTAYRALDELCEHEHEQRRRPIRAGELCSKCGEEIGDTVFRYTPVLQRGYGGTAVRSRPSLDTDPVCGKCVPEWLPELENRVYKIHMYSHKEPCMNCGREVVFVSRSEENRARVYCCDDCRDAGKYKKRGARIVSMREKVCEVCGEAFESKRGDAKTCSAKCRMRKMRSD